MDVNGNATAIAQGSATVTCVNKASGKKASVRITVGYNPFPSGTTYRFFTFNELLMAWVTQEQVNSTSLMYNTFSAVFGPGNVNWLSPFVFSQGAASLSTLPTYGMDENDVTVVYLTGKGNFEPGSESHGMLYGHDTSDCLTIAQVQAALENVPGTVVLIVDADCSGSFITAKGGVVASKAQALARQKAFGSAWTSAFASGKAANFTSKGLADSNKKSKFKVLVSCTATGLSLADQTNKTNQYLWFTYWLGRGLGASFDDSGIFASADPSTAPANTNPRDTVVTLSELYNYIKANIQKESTALKWQTVSVWPANDPTAILNPRT